MVFNSPESRFRSFADSSDKSSPVPLTPDSGHVMFQGRLTCREPLSHMLGLTTADEFCDGRLLAHAVHQRGNAVLADICGEFSAVLYKRGEITCITDPMGTRPLYYFLDHRYFIVSSSLGLFPQLDCMSIQPDLTWAACYLMQFCQDHCRTPYHGVRQMAPGQVLRVDATGQTTSEYVTLNPDLQRPNAEFNESLNTYKQLLARSVGTRIRSLYPVGTELSGGLDSSSVAALAVNVAARKKDYHRAPSHAFGMAGCEQEPDAIRAVAKELGIAPLHLFDRSPDLSKPLMLRAIKTVGAPVRYTEALTWSPFYEICREKGIRTLLSGFGGDEGITSIYSDMIIREMVLSRNYAALWHRMPGIRVAAALKVVKQILRHQLTPMPVYNPRLARAMRQQRRDMPVNPAVADELGLETAFIDRARNKGPCNTLNRFTLDNRFLMPAMSARISDCSTVARTFGVEYSWPLLDSDLIRFFFSLPVTFKYNRRSRYFHRRAMSDLLPPPVCWKRGKQMGPPRPLALKRPALNSDLHPDLFVVADINMLEGRMAHEPDRATGHRPGLWKSIDRVNFLDLWLKVYFPGGCKWQVQGG